MNKILAAFVIALLIITCKLYISNFTYPNTYLASINLSGKNTNQVKKILEDTSKNPIKIQIKDRVYQYPYSSIGIILDQESTLKSIFEPNRYQFPKNILQLSKALSSQKNLLPVAIFTQEYYQFIQKTVFDFTKENDKVTVDETNKTIIYQENEEKYRIDGENLKVQIAFNLGKDIIIKPHLEKITNEKKYRIASHNQKLDTIFSSPVYVVVKDNDISSTFTISQDELKKLIAINYQKVNDELKVSLDDSAFNKLVDRYFAKVNQSSDKKIPGVNLRNDFVDLINSRVLGANTDTIVAKVDLSPNTNGNIAKKYIEVDLSQQQMYLFQDGKVVSVYKISSGLHYPTPTGQFQILNKAPNAFSDIYNVWMPYWMAFGYSPELNAYFGIHELPYWVAGDGRKIQRPREFIGSPHTGGCVALDIGAANTVYDFAEVGMPVYIYN